MRQVFIDQEYKPGIVASNRLRARYQDILNSQQIPVIVDAGANIGLVSLWFAQTYPGAVVQAVEPEPSNIEMLYLNFGHDTRVNILPNAIGSTPGFVEVTKKPPAWGGRTQRAETGVQIITMSDAFSVTDGIPFIAKIDMKGSKAICLEKTWRGLMMSLLSTLSRTIGC
jgi:FkbM family methyltransferase